MPSLEDVYEEIRQDPYWDHLRLPGVNLVPGYGQRSRPKVMVVGEAPGATENMRGRPFCGPSGKVLDQLLASAGLRLEDDQRASIVDGARADGASEFRVPTGAPANTFITNVVKYRPPKNRTPSISEIMQARDGFKMVDPRGWAGDHERNEELAKRYDAAREAGLTEGAGSLRREWIALGRPKVIICVGSVAHAALHPVIGSSLSAWAAKPFRSSASPVWFVSQFHPAYGLRRADMRPKMERHWEELGEFLRREGLA